MDGGGQWEEEGGGGGVSIYPYPLTPSLWTGRRRRGGRPRLPTGKASSSSPPVKMAGGAGGCCGGGGGRGVGMWTVGRGEGGGG